MRSSTVQDLELSLLRAGILLAIAQAGGVFGRIVWGTVADRWIPPQRMFGLLGLTMASGAAATALFSPARPASALMLTLTLFGAAAIGWNGVVTGPLLFGAIVGSGLGYRAAYLLLALPALAVGLRFTFGR